MAHDLRPFRDYDEKDIINLFSYNASSSTLESTPVNKGTIVTVSTGWNTSQDLGMLEAAGSFSVDNVLSQRWENKAKVVATTGDGTEALGMTLFDVREKDENGELLKFNPRKAAEMQVVLAGQTVPIVTRGLFIYESTSLNVSAVLDRLYSNDGTLDKGPLSGNDVCIGRALGASVTTTAGGHSMIATGTTVYHTLVQLDFGHWGQLADD